MVLNMDMIKLYKKIGSLTKISDNDNTIRSNGVVGYFYGPPVEGYNFTIFSESITLGMDFREVSTSPVSKVEGHDSKIVFHTVYSKYMLEIFNEAEDDV